MSKKLRIDQNSIELDDINSELASEADVNNQKKAVVTGKTQSKQEKPNSLQSKRLAYKETKDQGAAIKVLGTKIAGKQEKENDSSFSNMKESAQTPTQQSNLTSSTKASSRLPQTTQITEDTESIVSQYREEQTQQAFYTSFTDQKFKVEPGQIESQQIDADTFQRRLDELLVGFRSDTLQHFLASKQQIAVQQAQVIEGERRRCNTILSLKQNEVEQLREGLVKQTKMSEEYNLRCEMMAVWSCQGKTIGRIKAIQMKCLYALQRYRDWKKHSRIVLQGRMQHHRKLWTKQIFQQWVKEHQVWKIQRNKEKFAKQVKVEIQSISANYIKEIETLRQKLEDANAQIASMNNEKSYMQEGLKKAFMRGVCALNFEAMNILTPQSQEAQYSQMEQEMLRNMPVHTQFQLQNISEDQQSQLSYNISESNNSEFQNRFIQLQMEANIQKGEQKIESKDHLWKPAPIVGREFITKEIEVSVPYSQQVREMKPYVLPNQFAEPVQFGGLPQVGIKSAQPISTGKTVYANQRK